MGGVGEASHIQAGFGHDGPGQVFAHAGDLRQPLHAGRTAHPVAPGSVARGIHTQAAGIAVTACLIRVGGCAWPVGGEGGSWPFPHVVKVIEHAVSASGESWCPWPSFRGRGQGGQRLHWPGRSSALIMSYAEAGWSACWPTLNQLDKGTFQQHFQPAAG